MRQDVLEGQFVDVTIEMEKQIDEVKRDMTVFNEELQTKARLNVD